MIKYKGVLQKGKFFEARIFVDGKYKYLGRHKTAELAAAAYNYYVTEELQSSRRKLNPVGAAEVVHCGECGQIVGLEAQILE